MQIIFNNRGEGHINTAVKVIIAVVIGALILGGLYFLFAGENGVISRLNDNIEGLMGYEAADVEIRIKNDSTKLTDLQYSVDGVVWKNAVVPTYAEGAVIERIGFHEQIHYAVVRDSEGVYIMSSLDNGVTWEHRRSFSSINTISISWDNSKNLFVGWVENASCLQEIRSSDGVNWKNYDLPLFKI